jgi:hypothetical protein
VSTSLATSGWKCTIPESAPVVEIDWFDENEAVSVNPRDQRRFTIQKDCAIEALRLVNVAERFTRQFDLLLEVLAQWVREKSSLIGAAIMTLQDDALMFVVMQSDISYRESLQDELADLDMAVARDANLDLIRLRTIMLPRVDAEELMSFLDHRMILRYSRGK